MKPQSPWALQRCGGLGGRSTVSGVSQQEMPGCHAGTQRPWVGRRLARPGCPCCARLLGTGSTMKLCLANGDCRRLHPPLPSAQPHRSPPFRQAKPVTCGQTAPHPQAPVLAPCQEQAQPLGRPLQTARAGRLLRRTRHPPRAQGPAGRSECRSGLRGVEAWASQLGRAPSRLLPLCPGPGWASRGPVSFPPLSRLLPPGPWAPPGAAQRREGAGGCPPSGLP